MKVDDIKPINPSIYPSLHPWGIAVPFTVVDKFNLIGTPYPVSADEVKNGMTRSNHGEGA